MDDRKEKNAAWLSVPQFGDWDQKGDLPDYSLDFSKIRETRKLNKSNISRNSIGNEEELIPKPKNDHDHHHHREDRQQLHHRNRSPKTRKRFLSYFNCCIKA